VGPRAGLEDGLSRPHRDSIPNRPARSQSELPGPHSAVVFFRRPLLLFIFVLTFISLSPLYKFKLVRGTIL